MTDLSTAQATETPDEPRLVRSLPPFTSFDLLEGEFARARKARMVTLAVVSVSCVFATLIVAQALSWRIGASRTELEIASTTDRAEALATQLAATADIAGLSAGDANAFIAERSTIAAKLASAELDFNDVLTKIASSVPAGVTLTGIDYAVTSEPAPDQDPAVAVCPSGERVPYPSAGGAPAPAAGATGDAAAPAAAAEKPSVRRTTIVVTAVMSVDADFRPWIAAIGDIPEVGEISHQQSGEAPLFTLQVTAAVNQFARSARAMQYEGDSGQGASLNPCFNPDAVVPTPLAPSSPPDPADPTTPEVEPLIADTTPVVDPALDSTEQVPEVPAPAGTVTEEGG